ncbi:MAG: hypothetical protein AB202_03765 [Parcubacteria bacterium C7867-007]|nr:MAG: hypothetical protein AB202_03765 [Parcubacteria bacterium C7867-007]
MSEFAMSEQDELEELCIQFGFIRKVPHDSSQCQSGLTVIGSLFIFSNGKRCWEKTPAVGHRNQIIQAFSESGAEIHEH